MNIRRPRSHNLTAVRRSDLVEKVQRGELDPAQATQIARHEVLSHMPSDFYSLLADLAKVPEEPPGRRQWFQRQLFNIIHDAWDKQENMDALAALTKDRAYADVIKHLRSAKQALAQLSKIDREVLWFPIAEIESGIDRFLDMHGADSPKPGPRRRGRPKGNVKYSPFRNLVWDLLELTWVTGGNLSLEKNVGRGTLIDAIGRLSQYLPSDLAPQKLSAPTLQRIKTEFQKQFRERKRPQ
jgi:hypothetical protein